MSDCHVCRQPMITCVCAVKLKPAMTDADLIRAGKAWLLNGLPNLDQTAQLIRDFAAALEERTRERDEARGVANANANSANRERIKLLNRVAAAEAERDRLREECAAWTARAGRGEGAVAWSRSRTINNAEGYAIGTDEPELAWGKEPPDDAGWSPLYTSPPARREVESGGTPVVCPQCQGRNIVQSSERLYHFGCIDCAYEWDVTVVAHRSPSDREAVLEEAAAICSQRAMNAVESYNKTGGDYQLGQADEATSCASRMSPPPAPWCTSGALLMAQIEPDGNGRMTESRLNPYVRSRYVPDGCRWWELRNPGEGHFSGTRSALFVN